MDFIASLILAFLGGGLSFLSPCVLPLVPAYISFAAGISYNELQNGKIKTSRPRQIIPTACYFVLGFSVVFIALGASASALHGLLLAHKQTLALISGGVIILFGLHMMRLIPIRLLQGEARLLHKVPLRGPSQPLIAFTLGLAFAFGWTPCIGPILASILVLAAQYNQLGQGVLLLTAYAAGLGVPFLIVAYATGQLSILKNIMRYSHYVERIGGGLLVITGILIFTGDLQALGSYLLDWFPALGALG